MSPEKNTRASRRVLRQEQRERIERRKRYTRRGIIGAGIMISLGTAAYLVGKNFEEARENSPEKIIRAEIERLGIQPNQAEIDLWTNQGFAPLTKPLPENFDPNPEAATRVSTVLSLMEKSANPYFKEAIDFLKPLHLSGDLRVLIRPDIESGEDIISMATAKPIPEENRLFWHIEVSRGEVLGRDDLQIAVVLTHEIEHIRDMYHSDRQHQDKTPKQREVIQYLRNHDLSEFIPGEVRAYSIQAAAFIYQAGLMGTWDKNSEDEELAAVFITTGQNTASAKWIEYISREKIRLGIQSRLTPGPAQSNNSINLQKEGFFVELPWIMYNAA